MARLKIHVGKFGTDETEITVDGFEISHMVRDFDLNLNPHDPPRVVVELQVLEEMVLTGEAKLLMSTSTHDLLVQWGWTPPELGTGVRDE